MVELNMRRHWAFGLAAVAALSIAAPAKAVVVYDWQGDCTTGCAGAAAGVLTLQDSYQPGTPLVDADFVSWSYTSSSSSYTVPGSIDFFGITGGNSGPLPAGTTTDANLFLDFQGGTGTFFGTTSSLWATQLVSQSVDDSGASYSWTLRSPDVAVPVPGSMMLGLTALALVALPVWRRQRR